MSGPNEDRPSKRGKRKTAAPSRQPNKARASRGKRTLSVIPPIATNPKLKVAAYCRVSTSYDEQRSSIEIQQAHFATMAAKHDNWELVGIYSDMVSGTRAETRPELQRLLADCTARRVDLVLTKSVSRFARNTTDLLEMVRNLTASGADIIFERENIDTRTMGSELLLTILASLAEDESHSISANCRWGIQQRFRDGSYRPSSAPYGYDLLDGGYVVNPAEAEVVRQIFAWRLEGQSLTKIAAELNEQGIRTKRAGQRRGSGTVEGRWSQGSVRQVLTNEAYLGNLLLQKTFRDEEFKRHPNNGELPQYRIEGHHEALVSREDFDAAQAMGARPAQETSANPRGGIFSGLLVCAECGSVLYHNESRTGRSAWVCKRHKARSTDCPLPPIPEEELVSSFRTVMTKLYLDESIAKQHKRALQHEMSTGPHSYLWERRSELERMLAELRQTRVRGAVAGPSYYAQRNKLMLELREVNSKIDTLADERIAQTEELMHHTIVYQRSKTTDRAVLQHLLDSIVVRGRRDFDFHFRCGLVLSEEDGTCR